MASEIGRNKQNGQFVRKYSCDSCSPSMIQGIFCHEAGCRKAWEDEKRECKECGTKFEPEEKGQKCCGHSCAVAYSGHSCNCEECSPIDDEDEDDEDEQSTDFLLNRALMMANILSKLA